MSAPAAKKGAAVPGADVVITLLFLGLFVAAYLLAEQWPFRAAFFPQLLAMLGAGFGVLKLIGFVVQTRRHRVASAASAPDLAVGGSALINEEEEQDLSMEYVFATAGSKAWAEALAWVFGFFVVMWLFGVFFAVPVFAFSYLKLSGGVGWRGAALYAAISGGLLYVAFGRLLSVPMPDGVLL